MPDARVEHFWDLWKFGTRVYSQQLHLPENDAWDMFAFYSPDVIWRDSIPVPTFWMQNRALKVGDPYSKESLEQRLKPWLQ